MAEPAVWESSGRGVMEASDTLAGAVDTLCRELAGAGAPWGQGDLGRAFFNGDGKTPGFGSSRDGLLAGLASMVNVLRGTAAGMSVCGARYAAAEQASTVGAAPGGVIPGAVVPGGVGAECRALGVYRLPGVAGGLVHSDPPPAEWLQILGLLESLVAGCQWPDGNLSALGAVRDALIAAGHAVTGVAETFGGHVGTVTAASLGAAADGLALFAAAVRGGGDQGGLEWLASACQGLAGSVDNLIRRMQAGRIQFIASVVFLAVMFGAAQVLAPFTAGLSEVGFLAAAQAEGLVLRLLLQILARAVIDGLWGAAFSAGMDGIGQLARMHEQLQQGFDLAEFGKAAEQGGVAGGLLGGAGGVVHAGAGSSAVLAGLSGLLDSGGAEGIGARVAFSGTTGTAANAAAQALTSNGQVDWQQAAGFGFGMAVIGEGTQLGLRRAAGDQSPAGPPQPPPDGPPGDAGAGDAPGQLTGAGPAEQAGGGSPSPAAGQDPGGTGASGADLAPAAGQPGAPDGSPIPTPAAPAEDLTGGGQHGTPAGAVPDGQPPSARPPTPQPPGGGDHAPADSPPAPPSHPPADGPPPVGRHASSQPGPAPEARQPHGQAAPGGGARPPGGLASDHRTGEADAPSAAGQAGAGHAADALPPPEGAGPSSPAPAAADHPADLAGQALPAAANATTHPADAPLPGSQPHPGQDTPTATPASGEDIPNQGPLSHTTPAHPPDTAQPGDLAGLGPSEGTTRPPASIGDTLNRVPPDPTAAGHPASPEATAGASQSRGPDAGRMSPRAFADDGEAAGYGRQMWADAHTLLTDDEKAALRGYGAIAGVTVEGMPSYRAINRFLRGQAPGSPEITRSIDLIDQALKQGSIREPVTAVREVFVRNFNTPMGELPGTIQPEPAYMSTYLGRGTFNQNPEVVLHLDVPAGTPAMYMHNLGDFSRERELLLGRGLQYEVDTVQRIGGAWHVNARILPPAASVTDHLSGAQATGRPATLAGGQPGGPHDQPTHPAPDAEPPGPPPPPQPAGSGEHPPADRPPAPPSPPPEDVPPPADGDQFGNHPGPPSEEPAPGPPLPPGDAPAHPPAEPAEDPRSGPHDPSAVSGPKGEHPDTPPPGDTPAHPLPASGGHVSGTQDPAPPTAAGGTGHPADASAPAHADFPPRGDPSGVLGAENYTQRREALQATISSGVSEIKTVKEGWWGKVSIVHYENGGLAVEKFRPGDNGADREELASYVSEALGAGAGVVVRAPGSDTFHEEFIHGQEWVEADQAAQSWALESPRAQVISLMDQVIGNPDRNEWNLLVTQDGHPAPFDHELAFTEYPGHSKILEFRNPFSKSQYDVWRVRLLDIRPEFERLGHLSWHDRMMQEFELWAGNAHDPQAGPMPEGQHPDPQPRADAPAHPPAEPTGDPRSGPHDPSAVSGPEGEHPSALPPGDTPAPPPAAAGGHVSGTRDAAPPAAAGGTGHPADASAPAHGGFPPQGDPSRVLGAEDYTQRREALQVTISSGVPEPTTVGEGWWGKVSIVHYENGGMAVEKVLPSSWYHGADREELASYVSEALGAGAGVVVRAPSSDTFHVEFIHGQRWAEADQAAQSRALESPRAQVISLMDQVIGIPDRHEWNLVVTEDGHPAPFDHELAFTEYPAHSEILEFRNPFSKSQYDVWRVRLLDIRPEFERLGHLSWHDRMMQEFELWAGNAHDPQAGPMPEGQHPGPQPPGDAPAPPPAAPAGDPGSGPHDPSAVPGPEGQHPNALPPPSEPPHPAPAGDHLSGTQDPAPPAVAGRHPGDVLLPGSQPHPGLDALTARPAGGEDILTRVPPDPTAAGRPASPEAIAGASQSWAPDAGRVSPRAFADDGEIAGYGRQTWADAHALLAGDEEAALRGYSAIASVTDHLGGELATGRPAALAGDRPGGQHGEPDHPAPDGEPPGPPPPPLPAGSGEHPPAGGPPAPPSSPLGDHGAGHGIPPELNHFVTEHPGLLDTPRRLNELRDILGPGVPFDNMIALRGLSYRLHGLEPPELSLESLREFLGDVWRRRELIDSARTVYSQWAGKSSIEASRLTRPLQSFIAEVEDISKGRSLPGMFRAEGPRIIRPDDAPRVDPGSVGLFVDFSRDAGVSLAVTQTQRVYVNARADMAPALMNHVVREIVDDPGKFPAVDGATIAVPFEPRLDNIVIYTDDHTSQLVISSLKEYRQLNPDAFMWYVPPMTNQVMEGVSTAATPLISSHFFGSVRAEAIYSALRSTMDRQGDFNQFLEKTLEQFASMGINRQVPHLNVW